MALLMGAGCVPSRCLCAHSPPLGDPAFSLAACGPRAKMNGCICVQINELLSHPMDLPEVRGCRCAQH